MPFAHRCKIVAAADLHVHHLGSLAKYCECASRPLQRKETSTSERPWQSTNGSMDDPDPHQMWSDDRTNDTSPSPEEDPDPFQEWSDDRTTET